MKNPGLGFAALLHSGSNNCGRAKQRQLELFVTAAVEISLSPADCFHVVDIVDYILMNTQSLKWSEKTG